MPPGASVASYTVHPDATAAARPGHSGAEDEAAHRWGTPGEDEAPPAAYPGMRLGPKLT